MASNRGIGSSDSAAPAHVAHLKALFQHSRDGIYLHDLEGRFLDANPAALKLLGYAREEISTLDFASLLTSEAEVARARATVAALVASGRDEGAHVHRLRRKDGETVWVEVSGTLVHEGERPVGVLGIARDLTERRRDEESIRFQALMLDSVEQAVIATDPGGRILYANRFAETLYGWPAGEMLGRDIIEVTVPAVSRAQAAEILEDVGRGRSWSGEFTVRRRDGSVFPAAVTNTPVRDERGEPIAIVGLSSDVSARRQQEAALRASEERYRTLVEMSHDLVWEVDREGRITFMSPSSRRIYGREPEEMMGRLFTEFTPPGEAERATRELARALASGAPSVEFESRMLHRDGREVVLLANNHAVRDADGEISGFVGTSQDVTERRRAEEELLRTQRLLERTFASMSDAVFVIETSTRTIRSCNAAAERLFGWPAEELVGQTPEKLHLDRESYLAFAAAGEPELEAHGEFRTEFRMRRRDGTVLETENVVSAIREELGWGHGVVSVVRDITERRRAEADLRLQATALDTAADAVVIMDRRGVIEWVNRAFAGLTGYGPDEAIGRTPHELLESGVHSAAFYAEMEAAMSTGRTWRGELTNRRKDGTLYPEALTLAPVPDRDGEITHFVAIKRDLTDLKQLEAQYLQAQKMESVGRLAGGIAHDFNNLLSVILGRTEQILGRLSADDPLRRAVQQVHESGQRAASLTRQLLAFSRKQILQPTVFDLGRLVLDWRGVLQRLLGETIELEIHAEDGAGRVSADIGQIEQVIMNLVVNARDAMPGGGTLTISVREEDLDAPRPAPPPPVPAGRYVTLVVQDDGVGMDEATRAKLFEPFFTTKGPGTGTGLGLATVYGIVDQSRGHVRVETREGAGSAFTVYLPRAEQEPAAVQPPEPEPAGARGVETVLVVEDEPALRELVESVLGSAGYSVLAARDGGEALVLLERHAGPVDLVFTDVVLPGMTGRQLAEQIAARRPGIRVLFASGYSDDEVLRHGVSESRVHFLAKPYTVARLLARVRVVLDAPP